jgi:two-component system, NarL family, response regulator LiaR
MNSFEPIRVLIAEDQQIMAQGLKKMIEVNPKLELIGVVHNGASAVQEAIRLRPDVILMDIQMPVMDGIAATREITGRQPQTKVVMVTSSEDDDHVFAALSAGAHGYCLKSSSLLQIGFAIEAVHDGAIWLDKRIAHSVVGRKEGVDQRSIRNTLGLSARQQAVLNLVAEGKTNRQIAGELGISTQTVKTHLRAIMAKLMVADRTQAAVKAVRTQR